MERFSGQFATIRCVRLKSFFDSILLVELHHSVTTPNFHGRQCALSHPHSNAVVDLNGDCLAGQYLIFFPMLIGATYIFIPDIFLVCDDGGGAKSFQIWVNNKEDGFSLAQEGSLPSGLQTISFADVGKYASHIIFS